MRDFNARTARELDHLEDQGANDHITEDIYEHDGFNLPRNNKDTEKNNYGEELLELCKNYNVHVLNGRLDGDSKGEITCIANDGASTVDYGIVNTRLFDKINSFENNSKGRIRPFSYLLYAENISWFAP